MSGGFSDKSLEKKLSELNNTAISIQQLSIWLIHHKKHHQAIVRIWYNELTKSKTNKKLTFLYLANDVVQNDRKTKPEFVSEFAGKLIETFNHLSSVNFDEKTIKSIHRLLLIWEERQIFDKKLLAILNSIWKNKSKRRETSPHTPPIVNSPKRDREESPGIPAKKLQLQHKETEERLANLAGLDNTDDGSVENGEDSFDPPDPEELIQAIQGLEDAATSDEKVREEISLLSPEVSDLNTVSNLSSSEEGEELITKVHAAAKLLEDYNERLENELRERRRVGRMIYEFLTAQKALITGLEERIDTFKDKLDKVRGLEDQVRKHLASLPDIPSANSKSSPIL